MASEASDRAAGLPIAQWASDDGLTPDLSQTGGTRERAQRLVVDLERRPERMAHGVGTGEGLVSNGLLGADIIRLGAGERFQPHTHAADHLLIVIGGEGTITCDGRIHPTRAGEIFLVEGEKPHAVGARTDHVLLAIGAPHIPVNSPGRMSPIPYQAITTRIDDLHCLICNVHAVYPVLPHELGCPHCPCLDCSTRVVSTTFLGDEAANN
jgi:mannose-6-phosphate isomerase-like protein (cupin superfamily)